MTLCTVCLTPLTADDIGEECTACYEEWRAKQEQRNADWWEASDA